MRALTHACRRDKRHTNSGGHTSAFHTPPPGKSPTVDWVEVKPSQYSRLRLRVYFVTNGAMLLLKIGAGSFILYWNYLQPKNAHCQMFNPNLCRLRIACFLILINCLSNCMEVPSCKAWFTAMDYCCMIWFLALLPLNSPKSLFSCVILFRKDLPGLAIQFKVLYMQQQWTENDDKNTKTVLNTNTIK